MAANPELRPSAQGVLSKTPLAHLLIYIADKGLNGSLVIRHEGGSASVVYFVKGKPAKARTAFRTSHLGRVLVQLGFVDEKVASSTFETARASSMLHGQVLVKLGHIDRSQLVVALREQLTRRLTKLFEEARGDLRYEFYAEVNLLQKWGGAELTPVDTYALVWQGMSLLPNEPIISSTLSKLGDMVLKPNPDTNWDRFGFSVPHKKLIEIMRLKPGSVRDVLGFGVLPTRQTKVFLYVLVITKSVTAFPPETVKASQSPASDGPSTPSSSSPRSSPSSSARGSQPPASSNAIPMARVKLKTKAVPAKEAKRLTPEQIEAFKREATQMVERLPKIDFFELLDVTRDAPVAVVRSAYFAAAKKWHPDKLPPELEDAKDDASRVFAKLSEAFRTLTSPHKRAAYVQHLERVKVEADGDVASFEEYAKAKRAVKKLNFEVALRHATIAYNAKPDNCEYVSLYAWVLGKSRERQHAVEPYEEPIRLLRDLIKKNEECETAHFHMGLVLEADGKINAAVREFERVLEINPGNQEAKRRIHYAHVRSRTATSAGKGNESSGEDIDWKNDSVGDVFSKLFKK